MYEAVVSRCLVIACILWAAHAERFLWFETPPAQDDKCTNIVYGITDTIYKDVHPDPSCREGALLWYGTWGRVHLHLFTENLPPAQRKQEFELCLTGGEAHSLYIWYDSKKNYWEPMGFPNFMLIPHRNETCRPSHGGTMDLFIEPPWRFPVYVGFIKWQINLIPRDHVWHKGDIIAKDQLPPEERHNDEEDEEEAGFFDGLF